MNEVKNNKTMVMWHRGAIAHGSLHLRGTTQLTSTVINCAKIFENGKFNHLIPSTLIQW